MPKTTSDIQHGELSTTMSDLAILSALQTQLSLISSFDRWLAQKVGADDTRGQIVVRVQQRLDGYRQWILALQQSLDHVPDHLEPFSMDARICPESGDGLEIMVAGPSSAEPIKVTAKDNPEVEYLMSDNYLGYMTKMCNAFDQAQHTLLSLLQIAQKVQEEKAQLTQPAEATVQTHIRRLKEYNDVKDIGQQLIGLIAENRGVPVGTLYQDGQYGVTAED